MLQNFKEYFTIYQEHLRNKDQWRLLMVFVSIYQMCDVIIVTGDAVNEKIQGDKFIMIYRILTQILLIAFFEVLLLRLLKIKNGLINLVTLLKFICVVICWEELDYYTEEQLFHRILDKFLILMFFVFAIESQVCQTLAIIFNLVYTLLRNFEFNSKINTIFGIKIIVIHVILQFFMITVNKKNIRPNSNSQLVAMGSSNKMIYTQLNSQRQSNPNIPENRNISQLPQEQKQDDQQTESVQQDQINEAILSSAELGIYLVDNLTQSVQVINPQLSNIIMKEDQLSTEFLETELYDFGLLLEEPCLLLPKFHRSHDIGQFLIFTKTLEYFPSILENNIQSEPSQIKRLQLLTKKISFKAFFDNLIAYNHLKYSNYRQLIDFSLKVYIKFDSCYMQVVLSPLIYKLKPQIAIFVSDITEDPYITQLLNATKNNDFMINDISQKIKQPLNCTISMLEIIMNTTPHEIREKYISPALAGCKLLINTANDILDYAQLQKKDKLDLVQMDVQIQEFVTDIINVVKSQAIFRGLKISINIKQNVPQFIRTDPNRLRQILINLLVTSIQATVRGSIIFCVSKSQLLNEHVDFIVKVKANETNFSILKIIERTVRFFKSQTLKSKILDLGHLRQYSQSILISFYLTKCLSQIPFEYNYERVDNKEEFSFVIKIQNLYPQFNQNLNQKRLSEFTNQQSFYQQYQNKGDLKRYQSQMSSLQAEDLNIKVELKEAKQKLNINIIQNQGPVPKDKQQEIQEQSNESDESLSDLQDDEVSIESKNGISYRVEQMLKIKPYFFDYVNETQKKYEGSNSQPSQQLTFGGLGQGRSSIYSSLCFTSGTMQPNDLLDCFEKMEKIKQQKNKSNCGCTKILICESVDLDLYALSHQLTNIGITYEYITQKSQIVSTLVKLLNSDLQQQQNSNQQKQNIDNQQLKITNDNQQLKNNENQPCCKGLQLIFLAIEQQEEELFALFNSIKDVYAEFKAEPRIIGLIGCMDEENRAQLRKLPFHDYLSKPIMIDALLFILAKWIKMN
ncbi:unnamed protein product (macronuclear) [Paramecium tetraurelia]|uniref:Response regulatory domain-containing protein n=1 Tax=Paramecium tetraurelia TaxID=5888 RepID=A0D1C2_PARTE|nr:uncharacterized protein GSPATT00012363001 [Paramecium tetraurelia]CAK76839.1 unnamed protein product [Paramecium tetraurelia]|eukprot:XP_001444236.1 hypothetical protein (macronuclear) [Paramecium tetraurelia strain d4-2]